MDLKDIHQQALAFPHQFSSLILATSSLNNIPLSSYACYVYDDHKYYLYLSGLAAHEKNLIENPVASLMFIENEENARQIFARQRLTIQCKVSLIPRDNAVFTQILDKFSDKYGHFIKAIRSLTDFQLFELTPESANYVSGFAKAYDLSGPNLSHIEHKTVK
ncbi:HugZ family pyridoxamine 5'-phosphate oxidase [Basilea psittacipulmonis]|uniref:Pyridoxamine 5'-phosphate oxidase N-terminal domain-containing protein n=1 Tax=Basilea psittacipulmonis DSM 24701 TaxID=1072685 RepID=A0A077DDI3_9BURK|nr:pyridoxamine 5'-phosphate oxidase family protein [Basilea psittacipulmonis]AIL32679.1 hypothetical protein IX83_04585 [Basilea psittacipulmonis DSM 24701]